MSESHVSEADRVNGGTEEMRSALFTHVVMQQSSMAMVLLGKAAHPETGEVVRDLEGAKLFIDVLEMLEVKTKGNLTPEEANLLKQTLMSLRMAFVEAVDSPPQTEPRPDDGAASAGPAPTPETPKAGPAAAAPQPEESSHKKFTKKY